MKRLVWLIVPVLALGMAAGALAQATPEAETPPITVFVRQDPVLGPILTDPNGMTLYLFTKDTTPGESTCYDQCATNWPPFTAEEPLGLPPTIEGELTTITRTDGTTQIAYNGIPLYYFVKDAQPGDTTGQGVGDVWYVVHPGQQFGTTGAAAATPEAGMAGSPTAEGEVSVELTEFTILVSQTEFKAGQTYNFNVTNIGQFPHEFVIEKAGANDAPLDDNGHETVIEPMDSGAGGTLSWTPTEAGTYQFACHVRTHYPMGMAVTIYVTE
ncbi:MAG: hypothetical protein QOJ59_3694 [Thermomicrobiales bacterium]|nr:hypothetical protein [Thermomicrobiales bacterium]